MSLIIKSGTSGNLLVVNADGSISVVMSGLSAIDVTDRSARLLGHVVVDNFPLTQVVSGTLDVSDRASRLVGHVAVDNFPLFQPVTGAVDVTDRAARILGHAVVDNFPVVQPVVQAHNTGRTYITIYADRVAGRTTEALETFNVNSGGTLTAGVTSYAVTGGKKFRITSLQVEVLNTVNVVNRVLVRVRSAGAVVVASPIVAMGLAAAFSDRAPAGGQDGISFSDGIEIAAGQQIGISQLCTVATAGIVSFLLQGYEY